MEEKNMQSVRAWIFLFICFVIGAIILYRYRFYCDSSILAVGSALALLQGLLIVPPRDDNTIQGVKKKAILVLIFFCGLGIWWRLSYFNGIGGHDDFAYLLYVRQAFHGDYGEMLKTLFGLRFLVYIPILAIFKGAGPSYWGAFLPVLVLSIAEVPLAYLIARKTGNSYWISLLAAWFMAIHPLNVFVSTTIRGDIETSFMASLCLLLFLMSRLFNNDEPYRSNQAIWAILLGFAAGFGVLAKVLNWVVFFIIFVVFIIDIIKKRRFPFRYLWFLAGAVIYFLVQGMFFQHVTGCFWQQFKTAGLLYYTKAINEEGAFLNDPSLHFNFLPALMFDLPGLVPSLSGWHVNNYPGFGMIFYIPAAALLLLWGSTSRKAGFSLLWVMIFLAFFEFGTMSPSQYIPPHKEPRYLSFISVPLAVIIAAAFAAAMEIAGKEKTRRRLCAWIACGSVLLLFSFTSMASLSYHHRNYIKATACTDKFLQFVNAHPTSTVWTYHYIAQHLELKTHYERPSRPHSFPGKPGLGAIEDISFFRLLDADGHHADGHYVILPSPLHSYGDSEPYRLLVESGAYREVEHWKDAHGELFVYRIYLALASPSYLEKLREKAIQDQLRRKNRKNTR